MIEIINLWSEPRGFFLLIFLCSKIVVYNSKYVTMISCFLIGGGFVCSVFLFWLKLFWGPSSIICRIYYFNVFSMRSFFWFFFFLITWWYIFFIHKWPLLLFEPYKSDSRAVNRDPPLGFGTPLGGKLGFWSAASPTWLVPILFKKDLCHCLWFFAPNFEITNWWTIHKFTMKIHHHYEG